MTKIRLSKVALSVGTRHVEIDVNDSAWLFCGGNAQISNLVNKRSDEINLLWRKCNSEAVKSYPTFDKVRTLDRRGNEVDLSLLFSKTK